MIRHALPFALLVLPAAASPQAPSERRVGVGSFDRVRVNGAFEVTHAVGSPGARVLGDPRAAERVEVRVDGTTLTIGVRDRSAPPDGGRRSPPAGPVAVALSSPSLRAVSVFAGGRVRAARMKGDRVDLSVGGAGEIAVADVQADQVQATLIGAGTITLAGRAARARLVTNGPGRIDASGLLAGTLAVLLDGPGETKAAARYDAQVVNTGLGSVEVAGTPKCVVAARAGGAVRCGR